MNFVTNLKDLAYILAAIAAMSTYLWVGSSLTRVIVELFNR